MNPGSVRLPQKELELEIQAGSYGDRFRRWYTTATTGLLPDDQRNDLMQVIRDESTRTATSAADNWVTAFSGRNKPLPPYLRRFAGPSNNSISTPSPAGGSWNDQNDPGRLFH
jgi:hypothetical protein